MKINVFRRDEGVCGVIITDMEYPYTVAQGLLSKITDEFLTKYPRTAYTTAEERSLALPELKDYLSKYQDPQNADSIMKIQKELDETKKTLHKTIDSILLRGEKIDNLVAKSDGLSAQSKMFYTQVSRDCVSVYSPGCSPCFIGQEAKLMLLCHVDEFLLPPLVVWHFPSD